MHSVPKSAEDGEFWSQYKISVKYLAKLDVSTEVVITDISVSFLSKILGRNQDFPKGSVWGEVIFQSAWGEWGFGRGI